MSRALDIEVLTWQQVRDEVAAVNTTFAKIIDELNPKYTGCANTRCFAKPHSTNNYLI